CAVAMSPVPGATSTYPSLTAHFAALPSALRHCDKSLPLKSTIASDGGSAFVFPAVTIGGSFLGGGNGAASCALAAAPLTTARISGTIMLRITTAPGASGSSSSPDNSSVARATRRARENPPRCGLLGATSQPQRPRAC